jgi:indolepyruvate ferredoxin oxidoreductase alpha subunit
VREAFPDAPLLKLGMPYPFPDDLILAFADSVGEVAVVEELDPFMENHLRALGVRVRSRHPSYRIGELGPALIGDLLEGKPKDLARSRVRKPVLCPGCGHRALFAALKKAKAIVTGDIGCYTLAATPPMATMHTTICMGAGVTVHEGLRRAVGDKKVVGVVGDSTFVHSGVTGLINAVYNGMKGLIIILDNRTTAMTGGQNHPATGKTIRDEPTAKLDIAALCRSIGVDSVDVIDPLDYPALTELVRKRMEEDTLAVIISDRACRLHDHEQLPAPAYHRDLCKTCGQCLKIDCPAILELDEGYVEIDESVCTGCDLCVEVCPHGALTSRAKEAADA